MTKEEIVTPEMLRQLLRYDEKLGAYYWLPRDEGSSRSPHLAKAWNRRFAGKEALARRANDGYCETGLLGKTFLSHRVIWAFHYGYWPSIIDHIDGNRSNNSLSNLREATPMQNSRNRRLRHDNYTGINGINWNKRRQRWYARIWSGGRQLFLGSFVTLADAVACRERAEKSVGYHQNHGKSPRSAL